MKKLLIPALISALNLGVAVNAQAASFDYGSLLVSRTVYQNVGDVANLVTNVSSLPGGGANKAVADGSFPNVFKNEVPDPSFGVSSAIFLDQVNIGNGSIQKTLAIDSNQMTTSFASKSELALNISADGKSVSFMGYATGQNGLGKLDVSNSNTTQAPDTTNPVTSTVARAIGTVNLSNGNVNVTSVNAYSGNNGRAVALAANGNYYMAGNAGNGSAGGTVLSQLSDNTGVQTIAAGQSGNTQVVGKVQGTFGSTNGYQRGFSVTQVGAAADKTGKDDNFRGLTIFNNTLYVTKGSGSNGVNSVYQVGNVGDMANPNFNPSTASINILNGFNTASEKVVEGNVATPKGVDHPFGMWFANSSTLFVADEGDGVRLNADGTFPTTGKTRTFAGLQEWNLNTTTNTWSRSQIFQTGLLDQTATDQGLGWLVQQDGLRNITGRVNDDGSYTIFGTTATISNEQTHDLGADANEIVSITIGANSTAANTAFSVVQTAALGQRFGGVALAPVPEPETYAMMLAGLGLMGFVARRRKNA